MKDKIAQALGRLGGKAKSERKRQASLENLKLAQAARRRRRYPRCPAYKNNAHRFINHRCPGCGLRRCPLCLSWEPTSVSCPNTFMFHVEHPSETE